MIGCRAAWITLFVLSCSSSSDDADAQRRRCEQLRDHLIDLRLAATGDQPFTPQLPTFPKAAPGQVAPTEPVLPPPPIDLEAHRAAMKQALGTSFIGACTSKMTPTQLKCALAAHDQAAVTACTPPPPPAVTKTASN